MISVFGSKVGKEEIEAVAKCMESQWMGFGGNVAKFEEKYCEKFGLSNFLMVDSGSNALLMAVALLNLPKGSEIILPSYTWVSCAQVILLAGHIPIFCDVDIKTMNVRKIDIEAQVTEKTGAVMIVDYAGLPVEIEPIAELGFPIIEDAAHAVYSLYNGVPCGTLADVAIYSFDAVKNLTVGEGGGITAKNDELITRAKMLRYCGIGKSGFDAAVSSAKGKNRWWEYNIQEAFIKMLPTNISAAIGLVQLDKIDELQAARKEIWDTYQREFTHVDWITTPVDAAPGDRHSYFTYCIRVPKRDELAHYLLDNEIYTTLRYHPLHMNQLYMQMEKRLPNSEQLNEDALSIPLHPRLTEDDVAKVINLIKAFEEQL
jgi:dTDP-4-amino-4,6-dideoxygalactose transaminase